MGSEMCIRDRPWTVGARVSDLALLDGALYLAVNGYGVAALEAPHSEREPPRFRYFYDPALFRWRTLTALIPQDGSLLCHLYFNRLLNVAAAQDLAVRGLCLLRLHPDKGIYRTVPVPFASAHPDWECVGLAPQSPNLMFMEWKYSGDEETRFQYTRLRLPGLEEQACLRSEFRQALQPIPADRGLPRPLGQLFQEAVRREGSDSTALHFVMRSAGDPLPSRYAHTPPGFQQSAGARLLTLHGFRDGQRLLLLCPNGVLLESDEGASPRLRRLPPLPEGFAYTDLFVFQELLLAVWEQSLFLQTGASGVLISPQP